MPSGVKYYPPHMPAPPYSTEAPLSEVGSPLLDTAIDKVLGLVLRELGGEPGAGKDGGADGSGEDIMGDMGHEAKSSKSTLGASDAVSTSVSGFDFGSDTALMGSGIATFGAGPGPGGPVSLVSPSRPQASGSRSSSHARATSLPPLNTASSSSSTCTMSSTASTSSTSSGSTTRSPSLKRPRNSQRLDSDSDLGSAESESDTGGGGHVLDGGPPAVAMAISTSRDGGAKEAFTGKTMQMPVQNSESTRSQIQTQTFQRELLGVLECDVCAQLLFEPVTTPCQHVSDWGVCEIMSVGA